MQPGLCWDLPWRAIHWISLTSWVSLGSSFPTKLTQKRQTTKKGDWGPGRHKGGFCTDFISADALSANTQCSGRPSPLGKLLSPFKTSSRLLHSPKTQSSWYVRSLNLTTQIKVSWRFCWICSADFISDFSCPYSLTGLPARGLLHSSLKRVQAAPQCVHLSTPLCLVPPTEEPSGVSAASLFRKHEDVNFKY